jgi:acylphosphatase
MEARLHMTVHGLVQGVGFRWFVARRAQALGVSGYVANSHDGSVEIDAEGDRSLLEDLLKEVRVGPRSAQVNDVRIEWGDPVHRSTHFEIR